MRRFHALLIVAGLAAMPASAAAGPFFQDVCSQPGLEQHSEWHEMKGRLGVTVLGLTPELRSYFGAAQDRGARCVEPDAQGFNRHGASLRARRDPLNGERE